MNTQDSANLTPQPSDPTPDIRSHTHVETDANGNLTAGELRHRRAWLSIGFLCDAGLINLPRLTEVRVSQKAEVFDSLAYTYSQVRALFELIDDEREALD